MSAETIISELLRAADIKVGGDRPQDIIVHDPRLYGRLLRDRELGLGEAYMDGWWDAVQLDETIFRLLITDVQHALRPNLRLVVPAVSSVIFNRQTLRRAKSNAAHHYNIGNDLYSRMLDKRMIYSCAYWKDAATLDQAQEAKLDLICRKLELKQGMKLLDIGCGWGGLANFAAERYGAVVTGISPAAEQVRIARQVNAGLPVTIEQLDYREVSGSFDRIVSVGMLEHVGPKNYRRFFDICRSLLRDDGMMLHHMIGGNAPGRESDRWIGKYIFPGGVIPSLLQISHAVESRLIVEDLQNFGPYYDRTLLSWHENFVRHYGEIKDVYDQRFYRMWTYYLLSCAGAFRARNLQLWQIVMRKIRPSGTYIAAR